MSLVSYASYGKDLSGIYLGTVLENRDPENQGRVKCNIDGVLEVSSLVGSDVGQFRDLESAIEALPWVYKISPITTGANGSSGVVAVPTLGSKVVIQFLNKDPYFPVYNGIIQDKMDYAKKYNENLSLDSSKADSGRAPDISSIHGAMGFSLKCGVQIYVNDATGEIKVWHPSSTVDQTTQIRISPEGAVVIESAKSVSINSGRDINFNASNSINITAPNGKFTFNSGLRINSSNITASGLFMSDNGSSGMITGTNGSVAVFSKGALSGMA